MAKTGRPPGAPNIQTETVTTPSRCASCGSTERETLQTTEQDHGGVDDQGEPYTHIIRRRVRCTACSQVRIDRTYENRAKPRG